MDEEKILSIVKRKKKLLVDSHIESNNTVIIDLYNLYCNFIKFNKYKTFSRKTYILCMKLIINKFKKYKEIIIVSKNIFEVEINYIRNLTLENKNIKYIIVEDLNDSKGENRERDDYVCLLTYYFLLENNINPVIITNDKYKNYKTLLANTKKLEINTYINGDKKDSVEINKEFIDSKLENLKNMCENNLKIIKFKFSS